MRLLSTNSGPYRSFLRVSGLVLASALVLPLGACANSDSSAAPQAVSSPEVATALPAVTVGLTYIPNIQFAPAYAAVSEKNFGAQQVELRHHGQNEGLFNALRSGQEDFVIAGADEAAVAAEQADDLLVVSPYYEQHPVEVLATKDSGIKSLSDLKGKRVGVPGRFGENWFGLLLALKSVGLAPEDVQIVEIGYTQRAAFTSGRVDALVGFKNNDAVQFQTLDLGATAIEIPTQGKLLGASIITTKKYAQANPASVRNVVKGFFKTYGDLAQDPNLAMQASGAYIPDLNEKAISEAAKATWQATLPLLPQSATCQNFGPTQGTQMVEFLKSSGLITKPVDGASLVTSEFCQ
ncbi:hypothetical protein BSR29_04630 [Boudabousia liubingyangii]|uniref:SsuA/THI5-like domain-containing protein n=1 Tax=Boudabousia liubingyangii TaxID=1921764 RepID=A0A1Q5PNK1_9ACTO|nr:ABC transporter substrate-binding protein [Boudabousia liubingyangii]OKL49123.1 hypothetical protein BSR29_04630 [Boudabousia liubingyangii]